MKFLNLRKLKDIALAVLCAAAVLFVMPVTAFADDNNMDYIAADIGSVDNIINGEESVSDTDFTVSDMSSVSTEEAEDDGEDKESETSDSTVLDVPPSCDTDETGDKTINDNDNSDKNVSSDKNNYNDNSGSEAAGNVTPSMPVIPSEPEYPDDPADVPDDTNNSESTGAVCPSETETGSAEEEGLGGETVGETTEGEELVSVDEEKSPDEIVNGDDLSDDESDGDSDEELTEGEENQDNSDNEETDDPTGNEDSDSSDDENTDNSTDDEDMDDPEGEASDDPADDEAANIAAADEEPADLEEVENPIINVVLPASISVAVNPYNLKTDNENGDFYYSILSPEYTIKNYSNCDISIVATVSASTTGGVVLSPYNLNGYETDFTAFVYLEAINEGGMYSDDYYGSTSQLAFADSAVSKEILLLADGSNGETTGYFKINGMSVIPDDVYFSSQAMINMVITFDIVPVGESEVLDAADSEISDLLDGGAVDEPTEDENGNPNDEAADNSAEDENGDPNDETDDDPAEDENGDSNDETDDDSAEDENSDSNDEAADNSTEDETGNSNDEIVGDSTEDIVGDPIDEIIDDTIIDSDVIYDDAESENIQEIIV